MKTFSKYVEKDEGEALFEMATLSPKRTGLPFVVWISPKAGAPHDVRVKISRGPKVHPSDLISVAIRPDVHVVGGGEMSAHDLDLLRKWVALNRDVLTWIRRIRASLAAAERRVDRLGMHIVEFQEFLTIG